MEQGWVSLYRKLIDWRWFKDSKMVHLFIYLLLRANHEKGWWQGVEILRGQAIVGRKSISAETGLSEKQVRTGLKKLCASKEISIKSTNRFSLITIEKYNHFQSEQTRHNQQMASRGPTDGQPMATNNNENNENKGNNPAGVPDGAARGEFPSKNSREIILGKFTEVNPACEGMYRNKTQLNACDDLVNTYGLEQVLKVINVLPKSNLIPYIVYIDTPKQLWDHYTKLLDQLHKENIKRQSQEKRYFV